MISCAIELARNAAFDDAREPDDGHFAEKSLAAGRARGRRKNSPEAPESAWGDVASVDRRAKRGPALPPTAETNFMPWRF
jgi:hypothetical protein